MSEYVHDMRQVLAELIDEKIPDLSVPVSILRTYLVETVAQDGGAELLGSFVSPLVGKTVGTALVEYRFHRLTPTMKVPKSLLVWLMENGVSLNQPDAYGDTAFFRALTFEVPGTGQNYAGPLDLGQQMVLNKNNMENIFASVQCDPLMVDGNGRGFLQCQGQNLRDRFDGIPVIQREMGKALAAIGNPVKRWETLTQLEGPGVAVDHQAWWKRLRAVHHADYLQATLSSRSASNSRPRF